MSESDRIKRIQARVVYADYLIQRDASDKGIIRNLNITSGDLVEGIALGPTSFTPVELNSVLVNNNVFIPQLLNESGISVPTRPINFNGFVGDTIVTLTWSVPESNGGLSITNYTIKIYNSSNNLLNSLDVGLSLTDVIRNLTNGASYIFTVFASNSYGISPPSLPITLIPSGSAATAPGAPTGVTGVRGNQQVVVSWTAPASTGGSAITGYTVTSSPGGFTATSVGTTATVTGLTNGQGYTFTVIATNAIGDSLPSTASASITPTAGATVPGAPTGVTGVRGNQQVVVSWVAPASTGGSAITGYTVTSSPGGFTATTSGLTATVTGLTNGQGYTFTVIATNAIGDSLPSTASASVTPATNPGAPTGVTGVRGNQQVVVSWVAPANTGGSAITGYTVTSSPGGFTATSVGTTATVTGLTNGQGYTFSVVATNAVGPSLSSTASASVTPATNPGAPTGVTGVRGNQQVVVSWTAPASTGGSAITNYRVTSDGGQFTDVSGTLTTATVTGLTNGQGYTFTVIATNAIGPSNPSVASASITPATNPGAPTGVTGTPGNQQVVVSWVAPASTGGSTITGYTVTSSPGGFTATTSGLTATVTGLTNGQGYTFTVIATNAIGDSVASTASASITPTGGPTVPGAPTGVTGTPGNQEVTVSWTAPSTGGSAITGYTVTSSPGGFTATSVGTTATVTGLTNGQGYTFTVIATNAIGDSVASTASASITPTTSPGTPTNVALQLQAGGMVAVSWTGSSGLVNGFKVNLYNSTDSLINSYDLGVVFTTNINNLTVGTLYKVGIQAVNDIPQISAESSRISITVYDQPTAPTNVSGTLGDMQATITWQAPSDNGGTAIVLYTVTVYDVNQNVSSNKDVSGSITTTIITNLTNGNQYRFTVFSSNGFLNSVLSSEVTVTPGRIPSTPTPTLVAGYDFIDISWVAPYDGGYPINTYSIKVFDASEAEITALAKDVSGNITSTTITGLTSNTLYKISIRATNDIGSSAPSSKVPATTNGISAPSVPQNISTTPGQGQVTVTWEVPASNGGSAITGYRVIKYDASNTQLSFVDVSNNVFTNTFTNLTGGVLYKFSVGSINAIGTTTSNKISVTAQGVPGPVTNAVGTIDGQLITITWSPPSNTGGLPIISYVVNGFNNGLNLQFTPTVNTPGVYPYSIEAVNALGVSQAVVVSVTYATAPTGFGLNDPRYSSIEVGNTQIYITWTTPVLPYNGASPITSYTIKVDNSGSITEYDVSGNITSKIITGLTNGTTYQVYIKATNVLGSSEYQQYYVQILNVGNNFDFTPLGVPFPPTIVSRVVSTGGITVSWTAPSQGGSPITAYKVAALPEGNGTTIFTDTSGTTVLVTGLTKGVTYTFKVYATNTQGNSMYSLPSQPVLYPITKPSVVNNVTSSYNEESTEIIVSWSAPTDTGGSEITSYTVTSNNSDTITTDYGNIYNASFTSLIPGSSYTFTVIARNVIGISDPSSPTTAVIFGNIPGVPIIATPIIIGYNYIDISWSQISNGGFQISLYKITVFNESDVELPSLGKDVSGNILSTTLTNLTAETLYKITVNATNIIGTSEPSSSVSGTTLSTPSGPSVPRGVSGTAGVDQVTINWSAPLSNGGSAITGYTISVYNDQDVLLPAFSRDLSNNIFANVINGMTAGTLYKFSINANNIIGSGTSSIAISVTPINVPGLITPINISIGDRQVSLSWQPPASNGSPITAYKVNGNSIGNNTQYINTGLTNGQEYTYIILAVNGVGNGPETTIYATPLTVPALPQVVLRAGFGKIYATWEAPYNGGTPITTYTIQVTLYQSNDPLQLFDVSGTKLSHIIVGLANGVLYDIGIVANNSVGSSGSIIKTLSPAPVPDAPTNVSGVSGNGEVQVSWTASLYSGGSSIINYTVISSPGNFTATTANSQTTTAIVTGLTNGVSYRFTVYATNGQGISFDSAPSPPVTPSA